jgi:hypothetical protein
VTLVIEALRISDPARAAAVAAEHVDLLSSSDFIGPGNDYRGTWDFLRALPAGKNRDTVLAHYFDEITRYHASDSAQLWNEMPDELRRGLVASGFGGYYLGNQAVVAGLPSSLDGLEELRRAQIEATGDPEAVRAWIHRGAWEWAERDAPAAIAWAQEHLKGEQRVEGVAQMFGAGATNNFDAMLSSWQDLPDGVLRARAAGNLADGAPAARKAEVDALLATLSPADLTIANTAITKAASARYQREAMKEMLKTGQQD